MKLNKTAGSRNGKVKKWIFFDFIDFKAFGGNLKALKRLLCHFEIHLRVLHLLSCQIAKVAVDADEIRLSARNVRDARDGVRFGVVAENVRHYSSRQRGHPEHFALLLLVVRMSAPPDSGWTGTFDGNRDRPNRSHVVGQRHNRVHGNNRGRVRNQNLTKRVFPSHVRCHPSTHVLRQTYRFLVSRKYHLPRLCEPNARASIIRDCLKCAIGAHERELGGGFRLLREKGLRFLKGDIRDCVSWFADALECLSMTRQRGVFIAAGFRVVAQAAEVRIFRFQHRILERTVGPSSRSACGVEKLRESSDFQFSGRRAVERAVSPDNWPLKVLQKALTPFLVTFVVQTGVAKIDASQAVHSTLVVAANNDDRLEVIRLAHSVVVTNFFDNRQFIPIQGSEVISVLGGEDAKLRRAIADSLGAFDGVLCVDAAHFGVSPERE